ncbi:MAG: hypothetical protein ACLR5G_15225 [Eubacteriales bacterium]
MYKKQRTISALLVCLLLASCGSGAVGNKDITDTMPVTQPNRRSPRPAVFLAPDRRFRRER